MLALNAWAHELPDFRRALLPIGVDAIITEPVPEMLARIGYNDGMAISDSRLAVDYYRTTPDGRLSLGKGGGKIPFAGRVGDRFDTESERSREVQDRVVRLYPELKGVPIAAAWQGPASRTANGMPYLGRLHDCPRIVYGHGYNGNGVGPSYTGRAHPRLPWRWTETTNGRIPRWSCATNRRHFCHRSPFATSVPKSSVPQSSAEPD